MNTGLRGRRRLPGDLTDEQLIARMIRVNQAGEYGAVRIYEGQSAIRGKAGCGPVLRRMVEQEREHLDTFNRMLAKRRVRPTVLTPIWHLAGFALGAGTALLGEKAAMACTVAVEEVIDEHYARQGEQLGDDEAELRETVDAFRDDELEHKDTALAHDAEEATGYEVLTSVVRTGSRIAIWLSERF